MYIIDPKLYHIIPPKNTTVNNHEKKFFLKIQNKIKEV